MGLFKRRDQTNEDLETMRAEMRTLREHLEQTDAVKDRLAQRLGHLDAENERLQRHVGTVEQRVGEVATKVGSVENEIGTVAGSISPTVLDAVRTAVGGSPRAEDVEGLRHQLEALAATLQRQQAQIADVAVVATDAAERSEQTDAKVSQLATSDHGASTDATPSPTGDDGARQLGQLAERVAGLDARINQVSLEITNQLTELSSDLDRVGDHADTESLIDRINSQLDDITGGQERLANEQARYAIQFRQDLAELADRLRKQ